MPPKPRGPNRPVHIPQDLWDAFGHLVGERERTRDLNNYIKWRVGAGVDMFVAADGEDRHEWEKLTTRAVTFTPTIQAPDQPGETPE